MRPPALLAALVFSAFLWFLILKSVAAVFS